MGGTSESRVDDSVPSAWVSCGVTQNENREGTLRNGPACSEHTCAFTGGPLCPVMERKSMAFAQNKDTGHPSVRSTEGHGPLMPCGCSLMQFTCLRWAHPRASLNVTNSFLHLQEAQDEWHGPHVVYTAIRRAPEKNRTGMPGRQP